VLFIKFLDFAIDLVHNYMFNAAAIAWLVFSSFSRIIEDYVS
jgi:hypothetical protein